jgi:hypothetical protein
LQSGDQYRIVLRPTQDCYLYVIGVDRTRPALLFPSAGIQLSNKCSGDTEYRVPDGDNWFTLDTTTGTETLYLLASRERLTDVEESVKSKSGTLDELVMALEKSSTEQLLSRGQTIQPDQRLAEGKLASGKTTRHVMTATAGGDWAVKRIRFEHRSVAP